MRSLWQKSLAFRRVVALTVFLLAALIVYLGSRITVAIQLPKDDLNTKAEAHLGEEMLIIDRPQIAEGQLLLSYQGGKNELADVSFDRASVTGLSLRALPAARQETAVSPIKFIYRSLVGVPQSFDDTCHTAIEIRRAKGSSPVTSLKLYQADKAAGSQRFREVILDAGSTSLEVTVSTDPPFPGKTHFPGCQRALNIGNLPSVDWPPTFPVVFAVPGGKIDLHFNPANPLLDIFTGPNGAYQAVSIGEDTLQAADIRIASMRNPGKKLKLEVRPSPREKLVTVGSLRLAANSLGVDIGQDPEKAIPYADGKALYPLDIVDTIKNNPLLGVGLGALCTALFGWVVKTCFPGTEKKTAA